MKTRSRPSVRTPRAGLTLTADEVIADYRIAVRSRVASVIGRREVLTGKAPFGIFGDGKEVAQLAMAKQFREGDWRSGYYRDQTLMFVTGMATIPQYFAQLYTDTDIAADPFSGGRQMVSHFATRSLDDEGRWRPIVRMKNTSADISPVAAHMARALGLAYASKLYRLGEGFREVGRDFSRNGDEVTFATIGNAGCAEGIFWEVLNAAGVLQVPLSISVWDDGFGISVPNELQVTKSSISKIVEGFRPEDGIAGVDVYTCRGWDYVALCDTYAIATEKVRREHAPALIHVIECTQPQGHSTSGSHERYKSAERMRFETEMDPIALMRRWMLREELVSAAELDAFEAQDRKAVEQARAEAYEAYIEPIRAQQDRAAELLERAAAESGSDALRTLAKELRGEAEPGLRHVQAALARAAVELRGRGGVAKDELLDHLRARREAGRALFTSHLYSRSKDSPLRVTEIKPEYAPNAELLDGRMVLVRFFDDLLRRDPRVFIAGEDVGKLGDVNLVFEGLNAKYGDLRVTDTGIREATILGQGIGAALRGLRPIVDIQYLDYLLYALELASDDLATLHYRTRGGQKAPVVIRTKGHRLQGIWHTGSHMALVLSALQGIHVAVPRDMTQAAGFYNTFFRGDDPALVIEVLSGYRLKERLPKNIGEITVPIGVPEIVRPGGDLTLVTYGALVRIALEAAASLNEVGIDAEVVDVRTLSPFDIDHLIGGSVERTGALLVVDEDVPGGASALILRHVLEEQGGYDHLEVPPRTLTATPNRTPVGQDGDYFTKPNREDIVEVAYAIARERSPDRYPDLATGR